MQVSTISAHFALSDVRQIDPYIFKAILVAAAVQNPVGIDVYRIAVTAAASVRADTPGCVSVFSHDWFLHVSQNCVQKRYTPTATTMICTHSEN